MSTWYSTGIKGPKGDRGDKGDKGNPGNSNLASAIIPTVSSINADNTYSIEFEQIQFGSNSFLSLSPSAEYDAATEGIYQVTFSLDIEDPKEKATIYVISASSPTYVYKGRSNCTHTATINFALLGEVPGRSISLRVSSKVKFMSNGIFQASKISDFND
jgi:hypothetical protein